MIKDISSSERYFFFVLNRKHSYKEKKYLKSRGLLEGCETFFSGELISWFKINLWQEVEELAHFIGTFRAYALDLADKFTKQEFTWNLLLREEKKNLFNGYFGRVP